MTEVFAAVETAFFTALSAPGAVSSAVFQHAPQDQALPVTVIGDIEEVQPLVPGGDPDRRMLVTIVALTEGEERGPCAALLSQYSAALDGKSFSVAEWTVAPTFLRGSVNLSEDGLGYIGLAQFQVLALSE